MYSQKACVQTAEWASQQADTDTSFTCFSFNPCTLLFDDKHQKYKLWSISKSLDILKQYKDNSWWTSFPSIPATLHLECWEIQNLKILYCIWSTICLSYGWPEQLLEVDISQGEKRICDYPSFFIRDAAIRFVVSTREREQGRATKKRRLGE